MNNLCITRIVTFIAACIAGLAYPEAGVQAETLYGIVSENQNAGYLVSIDTTTGDATLIGDTGLTQPTGLTYNANTELLYAADSIIPSPPATIDRVYSIDPATGSAEPLSSALLTSDPRALAYRSHDDKFYTAQPGLDGTGPWSSDSEIWRVNSATGSREDPLVGFVGKPMVEGLAVRPSDGALFGTGDVDPGYIFRIPITNSPGMNIEVDVRSTGMPQTIPPLHIRGLTFHPDCTLYGSDGDNLVIIDLSHGTKTMVGPFGDDVGTIGGIAFDATDDQCPPRTQPLVEGTMWRPWWLYPRYALWPWPYPFLESGLYGADEGQRDTFGRDERWSWPSGRYWGYYHRPRGGWGAPSAFMGRGCGPATSSGYCYSAVPQTYFNPRYRRDYRYPRRALPPWVEYER